jgi:regulator of sigma E protease
MPDILLVTLAVIFVLGIAINVHEFGHFIVAKYFKMRVEAYSFFGLGPRIWGLKVGHTDYRISAIPLGAYVKLYGDEATAPLEGGDSTGEQVPESELYEKRSRWQKLLVMLGGPFMNIALALAIPFAGALIFGVPAIPDPIVAYVAPTGAAEQAGLKAGDKIVAFDGEENPTWRKIETGAAISPEKPLAITVERGGEKLPLTITPSKTDRKGQPLGDVGMLPEAGVVEVFAGEVVADSPAMRAGMQNGDRLVAVNGQNVRNVEHFMTLVQTYKDAPLAITVERAGQKTDLTATAQMHESGQARIGIRPSARGSRLREPASVSEAAAYAVQVNYEIIALTGRVMGQMFSGERAVRDAGLAGPIGIVGIISSVVREEGFVGLIAILAVISLNLGIFNLLPIPLLDGGQIAVLGLEKVMSWFGRTLSMAVKERIQFVGLAVILVLMVFVMYLDISKFF